MKQQFIATAVGAAVGTIAGTLLYMSTNGWGGLVAFPLVMGYAFRSFSRTKIMQKVD